MTSDAKRVLAATASLPTTRHMDAANAVRVLISYAGDDPDRESLKGTPSRVINASHHLFSGYKFGDEEIKNLLKLFPEPGCDEMVVLSDVEFYSTCEHHMVPFFGSATIAYIPYAENPDDVKVVGISKLARLLDVYSRRLNTQERIARQITDALTKYVPNIGVACVLRGKHLCVCSRGVSKQHSVMTTSSMTGVFRSKPEVRAELFALTSPPPV